MIKVVDIYPVPFVYFKEYKQYTKALGVDSIYWLYTEDLNDIWLPTASEKDKKESPVMIAAYYDGELCADDVNNSNNVIPVINVSITNDSFAEMYFDILGNTIEFGDVIWTVCAKNKLIANKSIGKSMYNPISRGITYEGSFIEQFLNQWLDEHKNCKIKMQ